MIVDALKQDTLLQKQSWSKAVIL